VTWHTRKISEIGRVVTGKTPPTRRTDYFDGDYLFITPTDLDYAHYYVRSAERTVTEDAKAALPSQFIPENAVMFTCIGATIGKCGISPSECLTNQQINSVIANEEHDPKFIYYLLCNNVDFIRCIGGGSATPIISKTKFEEVELSVPTLQLQCRIAGVLSTYDDLIENNRRRMELLEDAARQLYREWFVRLRFPGYEHTRIINGVPEGWKLCRICDFGEVITGKTPSTKEADNYGGEIPFIKTPDMHGNVFVIETEAKLTEKGGNTQSGKYVPPGTLLVSCIGTIGVVAIASTLSQFNQQINAVIPFDEGVRYYCFFAFKDLKQQMEAIGGGATMGNVNKTKFENLELLRPTISLLREFDNSCAPMFRQIHILALQNQKLRAARDLLLPRLMSGEITV
jgi:type I restriction enzyme S subunit